MKCSRYHQAKIIGYRAGCFLLTKSGSSTSVILHPSSFILHDSCLDTRSNHRIQLCLSRHISCRLVNETDPKRRERIEGFVSAIAKEEEIDITPCPPPASLFLSIYVRSSIVDVHMRQCVPLFAVCKHCFSARGGRAESCKIVRKASRKNQSRERARSHER